MWIATHHKTCSNSVFAWCSDGLPGKKPEALGVKAPFGFIKPALAASIDRVPFGERWIHEIKLDGYRVQVLLANEAVTVFTRRGHDWTKRFKKVADDAWHIKASSANLDEEKATDEKLNTMALRSVNRKAA